MLKMTAQFMEDPDRKGKTLPLDVNLFRLNATSMMMFAGVGTSSMALLRPWLEACVPFVFSLGLDWSF